MPDYNNTPTIDDPNSVSHFIKALKKGSLASLEQLLPYHKDTIHQRDENGIPLFYYFLKSPIRSALLNFALENIDPFQEFELPYKENSLTKTKTTTLLIEACLHNNLSFLNYYNRKWQEFKNSPTEFTKIQKNFHFIQTNNNNHAGNDNRDTINALTASIIGGNSYAFNYLLGSGLSLTPNSLQKAVFARQYVIFQKLLLNHPEVDYHFTSTKTPGGNLFHDIAFGQDFSYALEKSLLTALKHMDINLVDSKGKTPIYYAIHSGNHQAAYHYLLAGADITRDFEDITGVELGEKLVRVLQDTNFKHIIPQVRDLIDAQQTKKMLERSIAKKEPQTDINENSTTSTKFKI